MPWVCSTNFGSYYLPPSPIEKLCIMVMCCFLGQQQYNECYKIKGTSNWYWIAIHTNSFVLYIVCLFYKPSLTLYCLKRQHKSLQGCTHVQQKTAYWFWKGWKREAIAPVHWVKGSVYEKVLSEKQHHTQFRCIEGMPYISRTLQYFELLNWVCLTVSNSYIALSVAKFLANHIFL